MKINNLSSFNEFNWEVKQGFYSVEKINDIDYNIYTHLFGNSDLKLSVQCFSGKYFAEILDDEETKVLLCIEKKSDGMNLEKIYKNGKFYKSERYLKKYFKNAQFTGTIIESGLLN